MDLLPQCHTEFTSPEYWNSFFRKRGRKAFEWYGEFTNLCGIIHKYVRPAEKIIMVGCGNSTLSEDMYDVGYHNISNIDISDVVIHQMSEKNAKQREQMTYEKMDVTQMSYEDGTFSVAFDKGTLDALAVDEEDKTLETVNAMFKELVRVLRQGGRYIIISLLQDHVLRILTKFFAELSWPIRAHRIHMDKESDEFSLPVFAIVLTKFKKIPGINQIVEVCGCEEEVQRLSSIEQLITTIKEMQYYGGVQQQLSKRSFSGEQVEVCLYSSLGSSARYRLWVVDSTEKCSNRFAIFIVPQGREIEWMFSTSTGRATLNSNAGFERLVVVLLSREHEYQNMESIKRELSSKVMELSPPGFKKGIQVPFLSIGSDIGRRTCRHRGESAMSGEYIVEDVEVDSGQVFRRLIFMSNQNVIQSEARLIPLPTTDRKKKQKKVTSLQVDKSYLSCSHHHAMIAGLAFLPENVPNPKVLLVGLGGGPLASFINLHFPKIYLEVVEIDSEISRVASTWFEFTHNEHVSVEIADGLDYIHKLVAKGEKRHMIMFDVNNKDAATGLSCPPPAFVDTQFLKFVFALLENGGSLILNMVCRDEALQQDIINRILNIFTSVMCVDIPQEVNKIIFASTVPLEGVSVEAKEVCADDLKLSPEKIKQAAGRLDKEIKKTSHSCDVDVVECMSQLRVLTIK